MVMSGRRGELEKKNPLFVVFFFQVLITVPHETDRAGFVAPTMQQGNWTIEKKPLTGVR